jgi:hypothetical protein
MARILRDETLVEGRFLEGEPEAFECTWAEWRATNAEALGHDMEFVEDGLRSRGYYTDGGGAAPAWKLELKDRSLGEYRIPEANIDRLEEKLAKLNKRAAKVGASPILMERTGSELVESFTGDELSANRRKVVTRYILVSLKGETPKLNGWSFTATLQLLAGDDGKSATILRVVPGQELPERFRTAPQLCEHCNTVRARRDTYVVRNEAGDYKQVGSSCLGDFLGHGDPHQLATWAEWLANFGHDCSEAEDEEWGGGGPRGREEFELADFLSVAAQVIRISGWISRKRAEASFGLESTYDTVSALTFSWLRLSAETKRELQEHYGEVTDEDRATAEASTEWVREIGTHERISDYEHNLLALLSIGSVPRRAAGIAASMVGSYLRAAELLVQAAQKSNEFIGREGDRLELGLTCKLIRGYQTAFGSAERVVFEDAQGNCFVWFTREAPSFCEIDKPFKASARIKKHESYNGRNQNVITRVAEAKEKKPRAKKAKPVEVPIEASRPCK